MSYLQGTREEFLADFIMQLPSESILQLELTEDQRDYWDHLAAFHYTVSRCWLAKYQGNDPFLEAVESGEINQWFSNAIWSRVNILQRLWKLIDSGHQCIFEAAVKEGKKHSFKNPLNLFCHIVETQANNTFNICLLPYHNVSNPARIKAWKIFQKALSGKAIPPQQYSFIKSLASQYPNNPWLLFSLKAICDAVIFGNRELFDQRRAEEAEREQVNRFLCNTQAATFPLTPLPLLTPSALLVNKLNDYFVAAVRDMEVSATGLARKRSSKNFEKFYSFTWHHGKIIRANKAGGTYSL